MTKPDGSPVEAASAWLLSVLDGGGWTEAEAIEAAREAAGVSARALTTARGRLVRDGRVEKRKAGRGAWSYRLVGRPPESEAAGPGPEPAASPDAGGGRAVPEVPERFAATLHALTVPAMAKDVPEDSAMLHALSTLARECGYTLKPVTWESDYKLVSLKPLPGRP